MIEIGLCSLAMVHILIVLYCIKIINSEITIILLYVIVILPALLALIQEYNPNLFDFDNVNDFFIIKNVNEPFDSTKFSEFKDSPRPNLYIQRWRKTFINPSKQFPLDRLAYLKAKFYYCSQIPNFWVRNSHLKQLVTKEDYRPQEDYEDDPHPCKMVNGLSEAYIHRRAHLYRKRKVTIVDRKQTTAHRKTTFSLSTIFKNMSQASSSDDSEDSDTPEAKESIPSLVVEDSFDAKGSSKSKKPSMWRRISSAFRLSSSQPKKDDDETDYEEYDS